VSATRYDNGADDVTRVREATDIVSVIGQHVALVPAGENFKGLCPFHADTKPSLTVSPAKQLYYCFGCGEGGNVFTFVMKREGLAFGDALRALAARAGITLAAARRPSVEVRTRDRLRAVMAAAADFYYKNLRSDNQLARAARDYLRRHGVADDAVETWRLGLAPDSWDAFLRHAAVAGFGADELQAAGLAVPSKERGGFYDRFRKRIVFPIHDAAGEVVAFGGRILGEGEPKYLNSPNTALYNKSQILYGLFQNRAAIARAGTCVVVEGYLDLIGLYQAGITNVVASCGTALTAEAATALARYARDFVLLFDGDDAGVRAARRAGAVLLARGVRVRVATLAPGRDPFDAGQDGTAQAALAAAVDWLDFVVGLVVAEHAGDHVGAALAATRELAPAIAAIPDELERQFWRRRLAARLGIDAGAFELPKIIKAKEAAGAGCRSAAENLLRVLIQYPAAAADILSALDLDDIDDERVRSIIRVIGKLHQKGAFTPAALADELEEADARRVSSLALAEVRGEDAERAAALAIQNVKRQAFARRVRALRARVARGDASYTPEEIRALLEEKKKFLGGLRAGR